MSHVFLSYARADQDRAENVASVLEQLGHTVWWDREIRAGKNYDHEIEEALDSAACVVVLWSQQSVRSDWVLEESNEGKERRVLVPVLIDDIKPPLGFRRIEAANLSDWDGSHDHPEFRNFSQAIARHFEEASQQTVAVPQPAQPAATRPAIAQTDEATKLPPPEPISEVETVSPPTDEVAEAVGPSTDLLKGKRVRVLHSRSRKKDAVAAGQVLHAAGARPRLDEIGLGVHDVHRGKVYFHEGRDAAGALTQLFEHLERFTPRASEDPIVGHDLVLCLVDEDAWTGRDADAPQLKGIRGVKMRIVHDRDLRDHALLVAEELKRSGALPKMSDAGRGRHGGNRGKVHYHRDAASAKAVTGLLADFGTFQSEKISDGGDFEVVIWMLPAPIE